MVHNLISLAGSAFVGTTDLMHPYLWVLKVICLIAFILLMVMVVALLYSGEVQNSEKGPISLVGKSSLGEDAFQSIDPIVTNNLDGKRAICTFYLSYLDRRQRPRRKRIYQGRFTFKKLTRSPTREQKSTLVGFWNPDRHDTVFSTIQDAEIVPDAPNLFAAGTTPTGPSPNIDEYYAREVYETRTVAISNDALKKISIAQCQFLTEEFSRIKKIKRNRQGIRHLEGNPAFKNLPNLSEDGHYYVEMKFSIMPWFVLMEHPDGQVKTTAWLTVLTSFFAMFMQIIYNGF